MTQRRRLSSAVENPFVLTAIIVGLVVLVIAGAGLLGLSLISHMIYVGHELAVENDTEQVLIVGSNDGGNGSTDVGFRAVKPGTTTPVYDGGAEGNQMPPSITIYDTNCAQVRRLNLPWSDQGGLIIVKADGSIEVHPNRLPGNDSNWIPNSTCAYAAASVQ